MKKNIKQLMCFTHTHTHARFNKIHIFKYVTFSLFILFTSSLFGQTYTDIQDSLFQHLDKNKIPTGVLYERVYPWAELDIEKENDFTPSYSFIKQAWLELYLASYNKETLLSIEEVRDKILTNSLNDNGITLGFVDFEFNSIDTQAFNDGSLYFSRQT